MPSPLTPRLPKRIAILDAHADEKSVVPHLLADLCEAYRVYERLSARDAIASGEKPAPPTELMPMRLADGAVTCEAPAESSAVRNEHEGMSAEPAPPERDIPAERLTLRNGDKPQTPYDEDEISWVTDAAGALPACDTLLIGCDADDADVEAVAHTLSPALDRLEPGRYVYLLCDVTGSDDAPARELFSALERACEARGLIWMGGAAVLDHTFARAVHASARMGMMRRPVSEGIDELILALRSGLPAGELIITPRIPCFMRTLAIHRAERKETSTPQHERPAQAAKEQETP